LTPHLHFLRYCAPELTLPGLTRVFIQIDQTTAMHQELGGVKGIVDEVLVLATVGVDDGILNLVASESLQAQSCL
jgi:hypothetical protein